MRRLTTLLMIFGMIFPLSIAVYAADVPGFAQNDRLLVRAFQSDDPALSQMLERQRQENGIHGLQEPLFRSRLRGCQITVWRQGL
ncbi:MAG: hypothetical protein KF799_12490 [Bdellovibrionales bacterium]|nr:hypothetical protein [Bdellovibrionales bacterium]